MPSNAWSHRRYRLPRPAVCHASDVEDETGELQCYYTGTWAADFDGAQTAWSGTIELLRAAPLWLWQAEWRDLYDKRVVVTVQWDSLTREIAIDQIVYVGFPGEWPQEFRNIAWLGNTPYTSPQQTLIDFVPQPVGVVWVDMVGVPPTP